jgi:membrane-bound lytic murein transglycosylase B
MGRSGGKGRRRIRRDPAAKRKQDADSIGLADNDRQSTMMKLSALSAPIVVTALLAQAGPSGAAGAGVPARPQEAAQAPAAPDAPPPFAEWLEGLLAEARQRGFSEPVLQQTLVGLEPLQRVIDSDRSQPELTPGLAQYLKSRVTPRAIERGRDALRTHRTLLARIETTYGVQPRFLVAIWGLESSFGRSIGRIPAFQALATLAWDPRRATRFRAELFQALMMVDRGFIDAPTMTGSWAGAMGQPQFLPSSYMQYAVDFDGDSKRDIWTSTPDALASIANYLKGFRWNGGETWGREVRIGAKARATIAGRVPQRTEGCFARRTMTERRPLDEWRAMGVRLRDGSPLPKADIEAGLVDTGERLFLVYPNYDSILGYNCAHYYAISVGLLADALR